MALFRNPEEAFLARSEPLVWSDCIIWTGSPTTAGYGVVYVNKIPTPAHRYAWERENGPIPSGMLVDHTCHVRSCVNADHLRLATRAQNNAHRRGAPRQNSTGFRGVTRAGRKFQARVAQRFGGVFDTPEEASARAEQMRRELYGPFAGGP